MKEMGRVVAADQTNCEVEFIRSAACEKCGACSRFGSKSMRISLPNELGARAGDTVVVEMGAKDVIGASAWAYIFPLCMLVAGALFGKMMMSMLLIEGEWFIAVCSLAFTGLSYLILRLLNPYFSGRRELRPIMVEIYRNEETTQN